MSGSWYIGRRNLQSQNLELNFILNIGPMSQTICEFSIHRNLIIRFLWKYFLKLAIPGLLPLHRYEIGACGDDVKTVESLYST